MAVIGAVSGDLPSLVRPHMELAWILSPEATGMALIGFTESIAAAHAFAAPGEPPLVPNDTLDAPAYSSTCKPRWRSTSSCRRCVSDATEPPGDE